MEQRLKKSKQDYGLVVLLGFVLLVMIGPGISFLSPYFSTTTRWLFVFMLFAMVVTRREFQSLLRLPLSLVILLYLFWIFLSYLWSSVPQLTLMKAGAAMLSMVAFFGAGYVVAVTSPKGRELHILLPSSLIVVIAAVFGLGADNAVDHSRYIQMYRGLTSHQNLLGFLLTIPLPILLWQLHLRWKFQRQRILLVSLILVDYAFIYQTLARAAMVLAAMSMMGFILALGARRRFTIGMGAALMLLMVSLLQPGLVSDSFKRTVYKWDGDDAFASRRDPWQDSITGAQHGGINGLGYGVSYGFEKFEGGFTAIGYGREKGNAQLAIVEELGIVGFVLYVALIVFSIGSTAATFLTTQRKNDRVLLGILTGTMIGFIVHSGFEAWWGAPGSVEFAFFWMFLGLLSGVNRALRRQLAARSKPIRHAKQLSMKHYPGVA